jgi:hypothetical protein
MGKMWESPYYSVNTNSGSPITIDVTASASSGLKPNEAIYRAIDFFKEKGVKRILDFGCGSLRHTLPLLKAGFQVCAVEFEEQFNRPKSNEYLVEARKNPNFSALLFPKQFIDDKKKFDVSLLIYVIQTMPIPSERKYLMKLITGKMKKESYLLYMSRYGQVQGLPDERKVNDGYFMNERNKFKTFYRDFTTEETHDFFQKYKLEYIKSLRKRGTDQVFVYSKGKSALWV